MSGETFALWFGSLGRWVMYAGTAVVIGSAGAQVVVRRAWRAVGVVETRPVELAVLRFGLYAAAALIFAAGWRLYAQTYSVFGVEEPVTWEYVRLIAMDTGWGVGWRAQLTAAVAAVAILATAPVLSSLRHFGPGLVALAVAITLPLTGHAVAEVNPWTGVGLQSVHVLGGGLWVGTLAVTLAATRRAYGDTDPEEMFARAINAFSPLAVGAVSILAVAGLVTAWLYLDSVSSLWSTTYGRTLSVKVLLFSLTGALGAYNWKRLKPELGRPGSTNRLRKVARFELTMAALVLAATAALVVLPIMGM